jgi:hypothetical protein
MSQRDLHEIKRGWIMYYLVTAGFQPIPPKALLYHLRDMRCPTDWRGLNDYLLYLEQKGHLTIERAREQGGECLPEDKRFLAVTLTAAGLDAVDCRSPESSGFRI